MDVLLHFFPKTHIVDFDELELIIVRGLALSRRRFGSYLESQSSSRQRVQVLISSFSQTSFASQSDPLLWANEAFYITQRVAYNILPEDPIPSGPAPRGFSPRGPSPRPTPIRGKLIGTDLESIDWSPLLIDITCAYFQWLWLKSIK